MKAEIGGEEFDIRGLTGAEVSGLNEYGWWPTYCAPPDAETKEHRDEGMRKVLDMALTAEDRARLDNIPGAGRIYVEAWLAIVKATYGDEDSEKN